MVSRIKALVSVCLLLTAAGVQAQMTDTPMAQVIALLDTDGGSRSGRTADDGNYIVAVAFAMAGNEQQSFESARIEALRMLNDSVNGSIIEGQTRASIHSRSDGSVETRFDDVVVNRFKGSLRAARVLKKGRYEDKYFVAMVLSETDIGRVAGLGMSRSHQAGGDRPQTDAVQVRARGVAPMKQGRAYAREMAIEDAVRNAVQQVRGVVVSGRSGMFNGLLSTALSTKTQGYVRRYDVTDETVTGGDYQVSIDAEVDSKRLERDVGQYLEAFSQPRFAVVAQDPAQSSWLQPRLKALGFQLTTAPEKATHLFHIRQHQVKALSHGLNQGYKTRIELTLTYAGDGELLFTLSNDENKTIYRLADKQSAQAASTQAAFALLGKKLDKAIVAALTKTARQGRVYPISVIDGNRTDLALFRHTLENSATGTIERWEWDAAKHQLTLFYRYVGAFTQAVDNFLPSLYQNYKVQGKGRRPEAVLLDANHATFRIIQ